MYTTLIILGMFFLFYLALGASVFSAIESPIEQQEIKDLIDKKKAFLNGHTCVDGKNMLKFIIIKCSSILKVEYVIIKRYF